ncbi:MAG: chromate transporter [Clostridia bacterium]|nr:chromate transporter [Clostridia bacterium]
MIYLKLFLTFLKIGAVSFGGGYSMIPLVTEEAISNGWLTSAEVMNFIAVAESTPGPIAINMATFVGASQGGILGAIVATLGVVLPSFIIILVIVALIKKLLKFAGVKAFLGGIRPVAVGLILATAVTMILTVIFSLETVYDKVIFDWKALVIFGVVAGIHYTVKFWKKKTISPILLIVISAGLGAIFYGLL